MSISKSNNRKKAKKWLTDNYVYNTPAEQFMKFNSKSLHEIYSKAKIGNHRYLGKISFGLLVNEVFPRIFKLDSRIKGVRSRIYVGLDSRKQAESKTPPSTLTSTPTSTPNFPDHSYFKPTANNGTQQPTTSQSEDAGPSTSQPVSTMEDGESLSRHVDSDKSSSDSDSSYDCDCDSDSDYVPSDNEEPKPNFIH